MAKTILEKGDLILITGGTGWLGSHIVDKALDQDLRVRLAIRNEAKANKLIQGLKEKYGESIHVETILMTDFTSETEFKKALQGVQGVIHSASNLTFSDKWDKVVSPTIQECSALLNAAHSLGEAIKRVILTGTSSAVFQPNFEPGEPYNYARPDSYNEISLEEAKSNPNGLNIYIASKVLSERFAWNFIKEKKPLFIFNVIHPACITGAKVIGSEFASSSLWIRNVAFNEDETIFDMIPAAYHIDANDIALLHILAATKENVKNERILAFAERFSWDQIIDYSHKYRPDKVKTVKKSAKTATKDYTIVSNERAIELLKPFGGFKGLENSIRENLSD